MPSTRHVLRMGAPGALAGVGAVTAMIAVYLLVPTPKDDDRPWLVFITILVVLAVYSASAVWALVRINRSPHPMRTGFVLLAVMITAMVVLFALTYLSLSVSDPNNFNVPLTKISALYFTMTILATVGFGDIVATSDAGQIAVMLQMVVGLTLLTALARVIVAAARSATKRKMGSTGLFD